MLEGTPTSIEAKANTLSVSPYTLDMQEGVQTESYHGTCAVEVGSEILKRSEKNEGDPRRHSMTGSLSGQKGWTSPRRIGPSPRPLSDEVLALP